MEFDDAIREGDGSRILCCWRYLLLFFRASRRTNYAIEAFTLLAQEKFVLSPRMALQLKWSRTVNTHGRPGKNIPMDLHMEHLNREVKTALHGLGSNVTDNAIQRIGKCVQMTVSVLKNFDEVNRVPTQSGHHTRRSSQADIAKIASQLVTSQVFKEHTGRVHNAYPTFKQNFMQEVCLSKLKMSMSEQFKKMLILH
jgi:L1 cell adhesion molecule like protein